MLSIRFMRAGTGPRSRDAKACHVRSTRVRSRAAAVDREDLVDVVEALASR
jgi:hypothetical protein